MRRLSLAVLLVLAGCATTHSPEKRMQRVAETMGLPSLERAGFLQLAFSGTLDESADAQGSGPDSKQPIDEAFAWDLAGDAWGWESRGPRGDGSIRWRRFLYTEPDVLLRVEMTEKWTGAIRSPAYRTERLRTARLLPQLALREAMRSPSVRSLGTRGVSYETPSGDVLNLLFDAQHRLHRIETLVAVPFLGDRAYAWEYGDWRTENGVLIPGTLRVVIGDRVARNLALQSVRWSREGGSIFTTPEGFEQRPERKGPDAFVAAPLGGTAQNVAPGVWFALNVTPGTNAMFVEQPDGVTVLEAPAGAFYPQTDVPAPNLVRGARSSGAGEALVDLVRKTLPGRPIRRLVLSHPHADHAGGVRAVAAEGAEIIAGAGAGETVRRFLAETFVVEPDRFERIRSTVKPVIRDVAARETIGSIEILPVDGNPHSESMLAVWIPGPKILFQGDLFYPDSLDRFPSPNRIPIMRWFAAWMERQQLRPERIYSTHGDMPATPEHLAKLSID